MCMNIFTKLKNKFLCTLLYALVLCKLIPSHIYKAQVPMELRHYVGWGAYEYIQKSKN